MNIIEATQSGKRFRRNFWGEFWLDKELGLVHLTFEDILATDWEIEERKVEITESEFDEAWSVASLTNGCLHNEIKKRLFDKC